MVENFDLEDANAEYEGEGEDCEESEDESRQLQNFRNQSQYIGGLDMRARRTSQTSNINFDSIIQEKDISIGKLQNELYSKDKTNKKWRKRFKNLKSLYKRKCQEFEESLAYLDIEGEQNKILEQKTVQLQNRVENEIKLIKAECEEIILNLEKDHSEEITSLHDVIKQKDEEIKKYKLAYSEMEDETTILVKNLRSQILSKENELENIKYERVRVEDSKVNEKVCFAA